MDTAISSSDYAETYEESLLRRPVYFTIQTSPSTRALSITNDQVNIPEYETILDYGQKIEILNINRTKKETKIVCKVVE